MYDFIHTKDDTAKERFIQGAELTKIGFPIIPVVYADGVSNLRPIAFNEITKEKNPRKCIAHFYTDDFRFERLWNSPQKYIDCLKNFKFVIGTDYSCCDSMPKALQIYQQYRNRVMTYYMMTYGINVIPSCNWGGEKSWDIAFDSLPVGGTIAITTNGRNCNEEERKAFIDGFEEMMRRLSPTKIVCIGRPISGFEPDANIIYLKSHLNSYIEKEEG